MSFREVVHRNRDENSFTSRLFEYSLFRSFKESKSSFEKFINMLKESSNKNMNTIIGRFPDTNIKEWTENEELMYIDGMLFVEVYDVYNFYMKNRNQYNQDCQLDKKLDKTELDCVIICKDLSGKEHLIVFEVKCYTDLEEEEIGRQNEWLNELKKVGMFHKYHHFALISHDNLKNAKQIFNSMHFQKCKNDLYIVTWQDLWDNGFIPRERFFKQDMNLYKKISYEGEERTKRLLAETDLPDI